MARGIIIRIDDTLEGEDVLFGGLEKIRESSAKKNALKMITRVLRDMFSSLSFESK